MTTIRVRNNYILSQIMSGILSKIYNLTIILKVYYWHSFYACILFYIFRSGVSPHKGWAKKSYDYFKVKRNELSGSKKLAQGKIMVFANHRCQADFFLHNVILDYQTNFLSRLAVGLLIPFFFAAYRSLWFFNRSGNIDPEKFNEWLDNKFEKSARRGLLAYPEGHRMQWTTKVDKNKLKTGMLRYAYRRKIKSQILMTFGNEEIFDQKSISVAWNKTVHYKLSQVIDPNNFSTEQEFVDKIRERFCQFFDQVYQQCAPNLQMRKTK